MKNRLITLTKTQVIFILLALFLTHRLMKEMNDLQDCFAEEVLHYPGINIKEF